MSKQIICHDVINRKHAVDISKIVMRVGVYGVLINKGKVLLSREWRQLGDGYDFPGGGMNIDENISQALIREFKEETGIKIKTDKIIGCESNFYYAIDRKVYWNNVQIYYTVKTAGGKFGQNKPDQEEKQRGQSPEWIDLKDITKIKFYNSVDSVGIIKKAIKILDYHNL